MSGRADSIVGVSVRPSELNLLASVILEDVLRTYKATVPGDQAAVFYLGDAINLSCGDELLSFQASMEQELVDTPWFMLHGNHDSFFAGMYNHFGTPSSTEESLAKVRQLGLGDGRGGIAGLEELAWIDAEDSRADAYADVRGSHSVCATPHGETGVPMNKLAWLGWYLRLQRDHGVVFSSLGAGEDRVVRGSGVVGQYSVEISGRLDVPPPGVSAMESWRSYILQSVHTEEIAVVLIDTSIGAHFGHRVSGTAGQVGRLGDHQLSELERLVREHHSARRRVYIAGHFPLEDVAEKIELEEMFHRYSVSAYFSAHTHAPTSARLSAHRASGSPPRTTCVQEYNVGSTTDWPMEAVVASLHTPTVGVRVLRAGSDCAMRYHSHVSRSFNRRQACMHEPAARRLATISAEEAATWLRGSGLWESPEASNSCDIRSAAESIAASLEVIRERQQNPVFRAFYACVATAASSTECGAHHDAECDARLRAQSSSIQ